MSEPTAPVRPVPFDVERPDDTVEVPVVRAPRRRWGRGIAIGLVAVGGFLLLYVGVTFAQVWMASRHDGATQSDAIVVLGAAQYDGRPSPVLEARLDHAFELWEDGLAPIIVVTGGKRPGDRFTEATASANYLLERGVPDAQILREVQGTNSWESLAAAARILRERGLSEVILVSDPFHALRIGGIADELGLNAHVSPTRTSPISGGAQVKQMVRETGAVAVGRVIGYRRLLRLDS